MSDQEDEYEEASPEQKLNIATYFIMSSPTGEVDDVVADVNRLVNDNSVLTDEALSKILSNYNVEQMVAANDGEGNPVLVTSVGKVSATEFVDPATGRVLKFDHRKRTWTETEQKQDGSGKYKDVRAAVDEEMKKYTEGMYKKGKCSAAVYCDDDGAMTVCLSGANVHLGNFWTGGWKAIYKVDVSGAKSELKGNIKVNVHYFEDGNVQLHTAIDKTADVEVSDPKETAKEVVKAIEKIESDFQNNLEEMYVNMHRTTFKSMRRFLPINRMPMNWTTAAHSLADQVSN